MNTTNGDEGRVEQKSSLRIKLFKETSRQGSQSVPEPVGSPREEWDRRHSIRTRFDLMRIPGRPLRP